MKLFRSFIPQGLLIGNARKQLSLLAWDMGDYISLRCLAGRFQGNLLVYFHKTKLSHLKSLLLRWLSPRLGLPKWLSVMFSHPLVQHAQHLYMFFLLCIYPVQPSYSVFCLHQCSGCKPRPKLSFDITLGTYNSGVRASLNLIKYPAAFFVLFCFLGGFMTSHRNCDVNKEPSG